MFAFRSVLLVPSMTTSALNVTGASCAMDAIGRNKTLATMTPVS
jgi:hypothetical protein